MSSEHKIGDTFDVSGQLTVAEAGAPVADLTGWTGRSQIRTPAGELISNLVFVWLDATQRRCRLYAPGSTGTWPPGFADTDIELTSPSGHVVSTKTVRIKLVTGITA
jgi:hypothetical protein